LEGRALVAALMIFPLGFFLGMPFPLGILAIENQPRGAIAWAWGMNGLFTVIGGLASVLLGLEIGFNLTIVVALMLYACALAVYRRMRDTVPHGAIAPASSSKEPVITAPYDSPWQPGATARSSRSQA
jgi:sugar phosphate permease